MYSIDHIPLTNSNPNISKKSNSTLPPTMSAPSQPIDSSRMNTDSTNNSSPGNILSVDLPTTKQKAFDENGAVGKQFTENGALGGTAQAVGGPLDKDGVIGKQFTTDGVIGGTVQSALGGKKA